MRQARSQQADSQNKVAYCKLSANSAGVVASISAEVGQIVGAGQAVVTVVEDNEKEVEINLPENRIEAIRQTPQLKVTFWALPQVELAGKVREIAPMADKTSRTYKVRMSLLHPPAEIKLGMTAEVQVAAAVNPVAAAIPISAIYQTGDTPAVWVVTNDVVTRRPVKLGTFGDDQVQVLEGLQEGDVIIIAGVHKLLEGQTVRTRGER